MKWLMRSLRGSWVLWLWLSWASTAILALWLMAHCTCWYLDSCGP